MAISPGDSLSVFITLMLPAAAVILPCFNKDKDVSLIRSWYTVLFS
jgi:hypothetical protein